MSAPEQSQARAPWFRRHPRLSLLAVVVVGTVVIDLGSTAVLHACGLWNSPRQADAFYRSGHSAYHHTLKKNVSFDSARWGNLVYPVRTNSLGFRDGEVREIPLVPDKPRIVLIGDSFTEGVGLRYEDTFAGMLDDRCGSRGVEVLNAGVVSYAPTIYLKKARYLVEQEKLQFDRLVVFLDLSDIEDEFKHYRIAPESGQVVSLTHDRLDEKIKRFIADHTILLNGARNLIRRLREGSGKSLEQDIDTQAASHRSLWTVEPAVFASYGEAGLAVATQRMDELAAFLLAAKIELTVVVYPWPVQIDRHDLESLQVTHWREWAAGHEAGFVNCFPAFIDERSPRDVIATHFIPGDVHHNRTGHAVIADCVMQHLDPLLPR